MITDIFKTDLEMELSPTGDIDRISGLLNIKKAIYRRITTNRGSIIHRPNYGAGIKNFQNSLNTLAKRREAAVTIKEQLDQEPRVSKTIGVSITEESVNPSLIRLIVRVELEGYGERSFEYLIGELP